MANGALARPSYSITELLLPGILLFQTREDATQKGQALTDFKPDFPQKFWKDNRTGLPTFVPYTIIVRDANEKPVTQNVSFPRAYAQSLNIPIGQAGTPTSPDIDPFPIRPLFDDEELAIGEFNTIVVHNKALWAAFTGSGGAGFNDSDRAILKTIASKLGIPV